MNVYSDYLNLFDCNTYDELYSKVETIARNTMGLDTMPFSLVELKFAPSISDTQYARLDITFFLLQCYKEYTNDNSDQKIKILVKQIRKHPPKESYENPVVSKHCSESQIDLQTHIFFFGIDLPGSMYNPFGSGHYSHFFMDMFFGNYSEFMKHVDKFSQPELEMALSKREGYCKYSPLFAPILGLCQFKSPCSWLQPHELREFQLMFNDNNEDKHVEILQKLLELGVDPNANDSGGFTALHRVLGQGTVCHKKLGMISLLLQYNINGEIESIEGKRPLDYVLFKYEESMLEPVYLILKHGIKPGKARAANRIRQAFETYGNLDMAADVREALPREGNLCEKCCSVATKRCTACKSVLYCSVACQKLDWKFHKTTCKRVPRKKEIF